MCVRPTTRKILSGNTVWLCAFWGLLFLLLLTLQLAVAAAPKVEKGVEVGHPPKYSMFTFLSQTPVANILYAVADPTPNDQTKVRWERVPAQGRTRLPLNSEMKIDLSFASLEHLNLLEQLYPCLVVYFSASHLDFEDKHMRCARGFKGLRMIDMKDTLITDKSLAQLGMFPELRILGLNRTDVTGTGFESLKNLHKVYDLGIEGINLKPGTIAKLKPLMAKLTSFDVSNTGLTKTDAAILNELKSLQMLSISGNRQIDDDCVKYLSQLNELKTLSMHDTSITEKSIPVLIKLPHLLRVIVREKKFWKSSKHQTKYGKVEFVDFARISNIPVDFFMDPK